MTTAYEEDLRDPPGVHRPHERPRLLPLTLEHLENETTDVIDTNGISLLEADTLPSIP